MTFRAFSIGFSAAVLALACGSDENNPPAEEINVPREDCDDNPLLAGCELPGEDINGNPIKQPPPANNGGGQEEEEEVEEPGDPGDAPADLARAAAENVLEANCGGCHGPALTPQQASAGMNYIQDIDELVRTGKIIPLDSENSRVIERMRDGSMPPVQSGLSRVSPSDIDTVAQFIDNPAFWPDFEAPGQDCSDQLFDFDQLYRAVAQDLQSLDEEDALTARYISLTNRFTAGVCADTALDRERQALFKMVNALSTETSVVVPTAVNREETIYRIDLEDYGWDEPVTVIDADGNAVDFADKWEAIIANNAYAVPFVGDDADEAVEESGTTVPVMFADSMLDAATIGNLYYALIDVDVQQTVDDFILNELEIDVVADIEDEEAIRAGTTKSRISRQDRVVERHDINQRAGVLWQSFDFADDDANQSIFEDPFGFAEGGSEVIFTLPNGLLGFIIADENGLIVEDSDILLDTNQNNFRAVTSISCSGCHSAGFIPVIDEVRDIAIANARVSGLDRDEIEQLEALYVSPQEFARQVEADNSAFFQRALTAANVPLQGTDPVQFTFLRFDQDMELRDAAGDLGLPADDLADELDILQPELNVLEDSTIDRDDFTQFYVDSLCKLSVVLENQPDPNLCAEVEALLEQ